MILVLVFIIRFVTFAKLYNLKIFLLQGRNKEQYKMKWILILYLQYNILASLTVWSV
jgi:hypothetical protein